MAILANRVRAKTRLSELLKAIFQLIRKSLSGALLILALLMLYFPPSPFFSKFILEITGNFLEATTTIQEKTIIVTKWLNNKFTSFQKLQNINFDLTEKLAKLENQLINLAHLDQENQHLRQLLNMSKQLTLNFVTARVISTTNNNFSSSMIVAAGLDENVKENDLVFGERGLIGHVSELSKHYATITLINDSNSRIPVITNKSKARGIIARQQDTLKIIYLEDDHNLTVGELVYSSGDGQIFPRNIPIALVTKVTQNDVIIAPLEKIYQLDYVLIQSNPTMINNH